MVTACMKVIKRKNYYYIANSVREDGKIRYKDRYLGKKLPKDILKIQDEFLRECMTETKYKTIDKIRKKYLQEWKRLPESIKKKRIIDLSIEFTYNTNAIEGSTITEEETENLIRRRISPNKSIDDIQETLSHSKVFLEAINEKRKLNEQLIKEWHKKIFLDTKPDIAGEFRSYPVRIGNYRAPDWQDVEKLMKEILRWLEENKLHPIELAARMHYRFEKIHPFGDGNGRIGRILIAYILKRNNYPIPVQQFKKRKSYYKALQQDENYFLKFFVKAYIKQFKEYK